MFDDDGDTFIALLHNVLLAPDLCHTIFSIIMLMNLGNNCLFHKGFCMFYFGAKDRNAVSLPQSAQRKMHFWGNKGNIKKNTIKKEFFFRIL